VKIAETTKKGRYTPYARICVYMNLANPIPNTIELEYHEDVWQQNIDYEHIPFRCRSCHVHGHLAKECPITWEEEESRSSLQKKRDPTDQEEYQEVKKKESKQGNPPERKEGKTTSPRETKHLCSSAGR